MSSEWAAENPWIFTKKTPFLQRVADRARKGANLYISGRTPLAKLPATTIKLAGRWPLNLSSMQASRRRGKGLSTYQWVGWLESEAEVVHWLVLQAPGQVSDLTDAWRNALQARIEITGYELVRLPRPGQPKPAWTWRYTRGQEAALREQLISMVRCRQDTALEQLIYTLWRSPGFAGVRLQVKKMGGLLRSEWRRSRSENEQMPVLPRIGFVQRVADQGQRWNVLAPQAAGRVQYDLL